MRFVTWVRAVCAGCVVLGLALGVVGTVAAPAPAATDTTLAAAATLAGFIPKNERGQCKIDPHPAQPAFGAGGASIQAALYCPDIEGISDVEYYLFSDNAAMNSVYNLLVGDAGSEPVRSTDGNCPSNGNWNLSGKTAGQVGCFYTTTQLTDATTGASTPTAEYAARAWTADARNILGFASLAPGDDDAVALRTWWENKAGPLATADTGTGAVTSTSNQAQYGRALLAHVPAAARKKCTTTDVSDATNNPTYYARRLWIRAAVECPATGGADSVVYESVDPAVIDGFFKAYLAQATAETTATSSACPDQGTVSQGKGKQAHTIGQFACATAQSSGFNNGAPYAQYSWTDRKLGIVAFATNLENDPSALIKWFDSPASGPQ